MTQGTCPPRIRVQSGLTDDQLHSGWNLQRIEILHQVRTRPLLVSSPPRGASTVMVLSYSSMSSPLLHSRCISHAVPSIASMPLLPLIPRVRCTPQGTGWKSVFYCNDWVTKTAPTVLLNEADTWLVGQRRGGGRGGPVRVCVWLVGQRVGGRTNVCVAAHAHRMGMYPRVLLALLPQPPIPFLSYIALPLLLRQAKSKYTLDIHTSDVKGAEFEGLAYVTLSGWWGTSKEVRACGDCGGRVWA